MAEIRIHATVKEVRNKTLVSGDKEVYIILSVVGEDVPKATMLGLIPADEMVEVIYGGGR